LDKYILAGLSVIAFFLIYNFILAFGSLEGVPQSQTDNPFFPYLSDKPLTEDGYYMLTVAWNIAEGKGFSYNYGIKTTGVQPLAAMVYSVPGYLVQSLGGDKYDFARAIIILSALLQIAFAFLVYKLALGILKAPDKGLYFLISICVVLLNFKVLLNFANGLETGLYLLLLSYFFLYWIKLKKIEPGIKHLLVLGLLTGLLLLCRLDSVVILFTFYLLLLFTGRIKLTQLAFIIFIAFLLYLPWQLYVLDITGNLLQSSARSQTTFLIFHNIPYKVEHYSASVIQHLTPFLFTGNILMWLMFPLGILYIFILFILYKKYRRVVISDSSENVLKMISFTLIVLLIIYFLFSYAPHFYFRYTSIIMILSFPVFVALSVFLIKKFRPFSKYTLMPLILIIFGAQAFLYLHSGKSAKGLTVRTEFVKKNFTKDERVASFQTGIMGYFCENVINLDGKIDNTALESFSNGGIEQYIDSMKINVLMEWKDFVPVLFKKEYLDRYWDVYSEDIGDGRTICYMRKSIKL